MVAIYAASDTFSALKSDGSVVYWGNTRGGDQTANLGASTIGLPAKIYVRLASSAQVSTVTGDLVISSLTNADDYGVEIDSMPLSGSFTGSSDTGGAFAGGGGGAPSGGGDPTEVKKSKKGKGKSSAEKSSSGSSKKSTASKSSGGKKSGGKKKKK